MKIDNIKKCVRSLVFDNELEYGILGLKECSKFNLNTNCKACVVSKEIGNVLNSIIPTNLNV